MIRFYHAPGTRGVRPIWLCEELGINYEVEMIEFTKEYRETPAWRKISPLGKVPVMRDSEANDLLMYESCAMVQYLLDRYGDHKLQPQYGTPEHAIFQQWCWFSESTFARPIGEIVNHRREFPGDTRILAVEEEMQNRAEQCAVVVGNAMADQTFILGDEFSAADINLGYTIMLAEKFLPNGLPDNLTPYWQRLSTRPAFVKATS
jgi:glutathione S-transferase